MRFNVFRATLAVLLVSELACSDPGDPGHAPSPPLPPPPQPVVSVQGVKVTPQVLQFLAIGESKRVSVAIFPSNATDQVIVWESTDSSVASVDSLGVVTARAAGDGIFITAYTHDGLHQASVNVSVLPYVAVQGVRVTPQVIVFDAIGQTKLVVATVVPSNATDQVVTWESTDSTVATVDSSGLVTAKAVGSGVFITAFTRDGLHQASVNVSVDPIVPPHGARRGFTRRARP